MFKNKIMNIKYKKSIGHYYQSLILILIITGFNYDFFKIKRVVKNFMKLYTIILLIVISVFSVLCCDFTVIPQIWSLIEYVLSAILVLIIKNKIIIFFTKLQTLDTYLRINEKHYLQTKNKLFSIVLIIWGVRIVYTTFYCFYYVCYDSLFMYLFNQFSLIALDVNRVWRYALYEEIRYRLEILRKRLEENPELNFYMYVVNCKTVKEDKIKLCLDLYKSIADAMDLMIPELHASMFVSVVCSVPKLVMNVYHLLLVIENDLPYESAGFMVMHIFQICFFLFSPCVVAELFACEIEKMRKILIHRLMVETDATVKANIQLFISYTVERNFRYKIWRIIPVNLSLPLEIMNMCTTYVIVIINYTHLYG